MATTIRILSYNIHQGITVHRNRLDLHLLKQALLEVSPDIVFLQEVAGSVMEKRSKLWPATVQGQLEALADDFWPHFAYAKNVIFTRHLHGNAVLSKYPIIQWNNKNITVGRLKSRGILHGVVLIPDKDTTREMHVMNAHLGLLQFERHMQTDLLVKHIRATVQPENPLVIAGDFNDWRRRVSHELHRRAQLDEAFLRSEQRHARTFPSRFPVLHLDRIYYRKMHLKAARVLNDKSWRLLSDHLPIMAEFSI